MAQAVSASVGNIELKRQIGLYAATAITVGNIIGSGIFRSPYSVAQELHHVGLVIAAWVIGGLLSLSGSLVISELAVGRPKTGGNYIFIREAFGDAWAFVFGWANLWVIKPTVIAAITSVFTLYFCEAAGLDRSMQLYLGWAAILILTFVNWLGTTRGAGLASLFTTLKVIGIVGIIVAAFTLPAAPASSAAAALPASKPWFLALMLSMIPILFAFDGWNDSTYVAGEIKNPSRALPIAIIGGTLFVIAVYVLTNLAFYTVLSPAEVASHPATGSEVMRRLLGEGGSRALAVLVAISTFGTANGSVLTGPRVTQAMALDGLLFRQAARIDPKRGTPAVALWLQAVLACLWLWFAGGFEDVSGWFVTTAWSFYGLTAAALFVQRKRERQHGVPPSDYRTPLYPLTAFGFIGVTLVLIVSDLTDSGWRAAAGVLVAALGFPVYYLWKGRERANA